MRCIWNFVLNTFFLFFCIAFNLRARGKFMDIAYCSDENETKATTSSLSPTFSLCSGNLITIWACMWVACVFFVSDESVYFRFSSIQYPSSVPSHANAFMISERVIFLTGCFTFSVCLQSARKPSKWTNFSVMSGCSGDNVINATERSSTHILHVCRFELRLNTCSILILSYSCSARRCILHWQKWKNEAVSVYIRTF